MKPSIKIDLISLFPKMAEGFLSESILSRALKRGILQIKLHDLRQWASPPHYETDDRPFGGGPGMVLKPEPIFKAIQELRQKNTHVIYMCPDGSPLNTPLAQKIANQQHLIILSGHYEGLDERVREELIDLEISIGDFVLTNGTLPAAVLIDAVSRYIPNVLGEEKSLTQDSFSDRLLTFPQYTRPADFNGLKVPKILLSGNHEAIAQWRKEKQIERTSKRRPDLIQK